jgi:hypothetical protein
MFRNSNSKLKSQSLDFSTKQCLLNKELDRRYNCGMTVHEKFVEDMEIARISTAAYHGRFFWEGPAARSDQRNGPTLQDIINKTAVPLQWDSLGSNYVVYPVGQARAGWKDAGADSVAEEVEADAYNDTYAAKTPKARTEEDED